MFRLVHNISPDRRPLVYAAAGVAALGTLVTISAAASAIENLGGIGEIVSRLRTPGVVGFCGLALTVAGLAAAAIGSGLAGKLPNFARPLVKTGSNRMIQQPQPAPVAQSSSAPPLVQIRCRFCLALNDEQAKCCDQCGTPL